MEPRATENQIMTTIAPTAATLTDAQKRDRHHLAAIVVAGGEEDMREWAYDSHKDFTGAKGRWAVKAPIGEVLDWLVQHFAMQHDGVWHNTVAFEGE